MHNFIFIIKKRIAKKLVLITMAIIILFDVSLALAGKYSASDVEVVEGVTSARLVFDEKTQTGYVLYALCHKCKPEKFYITPETEAFENRKKVPLNKVADRLGRDIGLEYKISSKTLISVSW